MLWARSQIVISTLVTAARPPADGPSAFRQNGCVSAGRTSTPDLPADVALLANRLGALAVRLGDAMDEAMRAAAGPALSHPEALTSLVNFADGQRIERLRRALRLSQPGAAHLVGRLEVQGLAVRRVDPTDRRGTLVLLTPKGRRVAARVVEARQRALVEHLNLISDADCEHLRLAIDALLEAGSTSVAEAQRSCRTCDPEACGHPERCPITRGARAPAG